jgi:hypothetical protein
VHAPSAQSFACGYRFCTEGVTYCQIQTSDVVSDADQYDCVAWPATCSGMGNPSCSCFAGEPCDTICDEPETDQFELICPGG